MAEISPDIAAVIAQIKTVTKLLAERSPSQPLSEEHKLQVETAKAMALNIAASRGPDNQPREEEIRALMAALAEHAVALRSAGAEVNVSETERKRILSELVKLPKPTEN